MSRRPTAYDDLVDQPRGSARPEPTYGSSSSAARPSRPRADDFMASASAYDNPSRGGYGGRREYDARDRERDRAGRERDRDYGRERSRSPPMRGAPGAGGGAGGRAPPPHQARGEGNGYGGREEYGRDGERYDDRGAYGRGGQGGGGGGGGRYDSNRVPDRRDYGDDRDRHYSSRDDRDRDPYTRDRDPRSARAFSPDHPPRDRDRRADDRSPSIARSEREPSKPLEKAEDAADVDPDAMAAMMGFGGFGTTHGQHVQDNLAAVATKKERKFRQYMNRRGGFNRPLDKMA